MNHQNRAAIITRSSLAKYFGFVLPIVAIVSGVALRYGSTKTLPEPLTVSALRGGVEKTEEDAKSKTDKGKNKLKTAQTGAADEDQWKSVTPSVNCAEAEASNKPRQSEQHFGTNNDLDVLDQPTEEAARNAAASMPHLEGTNVGIVQMEEGVPLEEMAPLTGETREIKSAQQAKIKSEPLPTPKKGYFGWARESPIKFTFLVFFIVIMIILLIWAITRIVALNSIQQDDVVVRPGDVVRDFVNPYAGLTTDSEFNCLDYDPNLKDALVRKSHRILLYETIEGYVRDFQPSSGPYPVTIHKPFLDYLVFRSICFGERLLVNDNTFEAFLAATPGAREYLNSLV